MVLRRIREEADGSETEFTEHQYDGRFPYRAEIEFETLDEIRALHRSGRVIGIRMSNVPEKGRQPQISIIGVAGIDGL